MHRSLRLIALLVAAVVVLGAAVALFKPTLVPTYWYYDLVGRWAAPLPADVERFVLRAGADYCAGGHDTECGGYRLVAGRPLVVGPAAQASGAVAAWCVDYVTLRRNLGRTGELIYWSNIPGAMLVTRASDGHLEPGFAENCRAASLE